MAIYVCVSLNVNTCVSTSIPSCVRTSAIDSSFLTCISDTYFQEKCKCGCVCVEVGNVEFVLKMFSESDGNDRNG